MSSGPSWESKTEEMRNERNDEFAPPQFYNGNSGERKGQPGTAKNLKKRKANDEDDLTDDPLAKGLRNLKNLVNL